MTLAELYEQQDRDIEKFKTLRDKTWADLQKEHGQITEAFGTKEKVPADIRKRMEDQIKQYREDWSMYTGNNHKALVREHEKQREQMTGEAKKQARNDNNPLNDEQQQKLQKIIAQQKAIQKRNEEKKRKR